MQQLFDAIKCLTDLEQTTKRNLKKAFLYSQLDNPILKEMFRRTYDWRLTYGLTVPPINQPKMAAAFVPVVPVDQEWQRFLNLLDAFAERSLTGNAAIDAIDKFLRSVPPERAIWYSRIANRDLRVGVNVATYGEVWEDLKSCFGVALAEVFSEESELSYPLLVEPKIDGLRITMIFRDGKGVAKTRGNNEYNDVLAHMLKLLGPHVVNGAVDGEIYADWAFTGPQACFGGKRYKSPWGKTSAMLKTGTTSRGFDPSRVTMEMWSEIHADLKFYAFDYVDLNVYEPSIAEDKRPFRERRQALEKLVADVRSSANYRTTIELVEQREVFTREEVDSAHADFLARAYEGSMIKQPNATYRPDRTSAFLKRKEEEIIDGVILEVLPGTGRNAHWAGAYRVLLNNGTETRCNIRGDADRQEHWDMKEEMRGMRMEMTAQKDALAVTDAARFPVRHRIRYDLPKVNLE